MAKSEAKSKRKIKKVVLVPPMMSTTRRDKVAAALVKLADREALATPLDDKAKQELYGLTDDIISLWDALNGK